ncbi:uncharacterized protein (TIGR03086 family) [Nonomuraea fuscirosea]|uniref:Uncharacterized protein (TIGR03086 family) n=1 Tax=Nonomuraea fuscirosea TaxID=1291556 RepID=A0A2T0LLY7_9ACTN|nr:TIGR03086 family metal-binding protein [Nonomuraea fuscirosea]PRX44054.1 uncharacterized protein (TIGR03086 family) [Nonomuraea fuscirosea]
MPIDYAIRLLGAAIDYAYECVTPVRSQDLPKPTSCAGGDVEALLWHLNDSLELLYQGLTAAVIGWEPVIQEGDDPIAFFHACTRRVRVVAATSGRPDSPIAIGDRYLPRGLLLAVGTVEVTVHAWDIAWSCRRDRPVPPPLAAGVLELLPLVLTTRTSHLQHGPPLPVPDGAGPGDRLIARLGRSVSS